MFIRDMSASLSWSPNLEAFPLPLSVIPEYEVPGNLPFHYRIRPTIWFMRWSKAHGLFILQSSGFRSGSLYLSFHSVCFICSLDRSFILCCLWTMIDIISHVRFDQMIVRYQRNIQRFEKISFAMKCTASFSVLEIGYLKTRWMCSVILPLLGAFCPSFLPLCPGVIGDLLVTFLSFLWWVYCTKPGTICQQFLLFNLNCLIFQIFPYILAANSIYASPYASQFIL